MAPWNQIDRSELQVGDHIYTFRSLHAYSHHGIYVGEDQVIHYNRTESSPERWPSRRRRCQKCGYDPASERGVIKTCLHECFLKGKSHVYLFKYGCSSLRFLAETMGTCSTAECDGPGEAAAARAEAMLRSKGFGKFDLLENNCESFASYCKTGRPFSSQAVYAAAFADVLAGGLRKGFYSPPRVAITCLKSLIVPRLEALEREKMLHRQPHSSTCEPGCGSGRVGTGPIDTKVI